MTPEIVHFSDRRKKKNTSNQVKDEETSNITPSRSKATLDMRRTRMEVFKFGLSGMDDKGKVDAKTAHAIKLGARPPKNKFANYKDIMAQKKQEKEEAIQSRIEAARYKLTIPGKSQSTKNKKRKKDANDVGKFNPQPGVFKGGALVIKKSKLFSKRK